MSPTARFSTFVLVVGVCATMFLAAPRATSTPTRTITLPATPTAASTATPHPSPTPLLTATPTAAPTASPTALPTASPIGLVGIQSIISDDPGRIDPATVKAEIERIYASNPYLQDLKGVVDRCADKQIDVLEACLIAIQNTYGPGDAQTWGAGTGYLATGDTDYYQLAKDFYALAVQSHKADKGRLDYSLHELFP